MSNVQHEDEAIYAEKSVDAVKQLIELNKLEDAKTLLPILLSLNPNEELKKLSEEIVRSYPSVSNDNQNKYEQKKQNTVSGNYLHPSENGSLGNHNPDNSNKTSVDKNISEENQEIVGNIHGECKYDQQGIKHKINIVSEINRQNARERNQVNHSFANTTKVTSSDNKENEKNIDHNLNKPKIDQKEPISAEKMNNEDNNQGQVTSVEDGAAANARAEVVVRINEVMENSFRIRIQVLLMEVRLLRDDFKSLLIDKPEERENLLATFSETYEKIVAFISSAYAGDNYDEVEKMLGFAEDCYESTKDKLPKKIVTNQKETNQSIPIKMVHVPGERTKATIKGNEGDENICLNKAFKAYKDEDYDRAKKFLNKAMRMNPNPNKLVIKLMKQVKDAQEDAARAAEAKKLEDEARRKQDTETDEQRAQKYVSLAALALDDKDYDDAADCVLKAQNIWPKIKVTKLLQRINDGKNKRDSTLTGSGENNNATEIDNEVPPSTLSRDETVVINLFRRAFDAGNYDTAKNVLFNAQSRLPNLQIVCYLDEVNTAQRKMKNVEDAKKRKEKEMSLNVIRKNIDNGNIVTAEKILRQFREKYPKYNVSELESRIADARAKIDAEKQQAQEVYLKLAIETFEKGKYDEAEELLEKIKLDFPASGDEIDEILLQVRSTRASRSSSQDTDKQILEEIEKNKQESEKCYGFALDFFNRKEYGNSKKFLIVAQSHFHDTKVNDLLEEINNILNSPNPAGIGPDHDQKCPDCLYPEYNTSQLLYDKAYHAFIENKHMEAKKRIMEALDIHECPRSRSLLSKIESAIVKDSEESKLRNGKKWRKSDRFDDKNSSDIERQENETTPLKISLNYEAMDSLKIAEEAYKKGDISRAKHFFEKSHRLFPNERATEMLKKLQDPYGPNQARRDDTHPPNSTYSKKPIETLSEENARNALDSIQKAQEFLEEGNIVKAERFLKKAERFDPNGEEARVMLHQVYTAVEAFKATAKASTSTEDKESPEATKLEEKELIADRLMEFAKCHLQRKYYDAAKLFAETAFKTHKCDKTKMLLDNVKSTIKDNAVELSNNQKQKKKRIEWRNRFR